MSSDIHHEEETHMANKENESLGFQQGSKGHEVERVEEAISSRVNSPRRVRDIHLDGTTDNMPDVDPYMLDEQDLDIHSDAGGEAGSVISDFSTRSWKSSPSARVHLTKSVASSAPRSSIASRARNIKDHEGAPFLSIDLRMDSNTKPDSTMKGKSKSSMRSSHQSLLSASSSGLLSQRSPRSFNPGTIGFSSPRVPGPRVASMSSFSSPVRNPTKPNVNLKMPFKHTTDKPTIKPSPTSPAQGLTERTALATHLVSKIIKEERPTRTVYIQGRLLKARLKPMEPVQATEPSIRQCRGIVAETRSYSASNSRTYQRWKAIMSGSSVPTDLNLTQDIKDRASTCESVHRTSEASSPTPTVDLFKDLEDYLEEERLGYDGVDAKILDGEVQGSQSRALTSISLPNSQSGPVHCDEDIPGPDLQAVRGLSREDTLSTEREEMANDETTVEQKQQNGISTNLTNGESDDKHGTESVVSNSTLFQQSELGGSSVDENDNTGQKNSQSTSKRPHSATYPQESQWTRPPSLRPKTAVETSRKAVRFADQSKVGMKGEEALKSDLTVSDKGNSQNGIGSTRKGKSSCRPHSLDSGFHDRDENDEGGHDEKNSLFLTQGSNQTGHKSDSKQNKSTTANGKNTPNKNQSSQNVYLTCNTANLPEKTSRNSISRNDVKEESSTSRQTSVKENHNTVRPMSASVFYEETMKNSKCEKRKTKKNMNIKQHLDQRFGSYKKNYKDEKAEKMLTTDRKPDVFLDNDENKVENSSCESSDQVKETSSKPDLNTETPETFKDEQVELISTVGEFFKTTDYSKYSRVPHRPPSSNSRKAKAYKNLKSKTRSGSGRPFSGSTYSDREVSARKSRIGSARKDLRPNSAQSFAEKTLILSKHGMIGHTVFKDRPNSASQRPGSASSQKQKPSKKSEASEISSQEKTRTDLAENKFPKQRVKSASKVRFAERDEYEEDSKLSSRQFSAGTFKEGRKTSHMSLLSAESHNSSALSSCGDDGMSDADRMWEELPCDDSDDEYHDTKPVVEEDYFLSKFDLLETEFEVTKAELRGERMKSLIDFHKIKSDLLIDSDNISSLDKLTIQSRPSLLNSGSTFLTSGGETVRPEDGTEHKENISGSDVKMRSKTVDTITGEDDTNKPQVPKVFTMARFQRTEFLLDAAISSSLYKKTNLYVQVGKKDQTKQLQRSESKKRLTRGDKRKEVLLSKENSDEEIKKVDNQGEKSRKNESENNIEPRAKPEDGEDTKVWLERDLVSKAKLENSKRPKDGNSVTAVSSNTEDGDRWKREKQMAKTKTELKKDYPFLMSMQGDDGWDAVQSGKVEEDLTDEMKLFQDEPDNYQELLLAYRQHCMEIDNSYEEKEGDSMSKSTVRGKSGINSSSGRQKQTDTKPKPAIGCGKKGNFKRSDVNDTTASDPKTKVRPWSGITNDSGLESDNQSNLEEENLNIVVNQSEIMSVGNDQSQQLERQNSQSGTRCDSGLSQTDDKKITDNIHETDGGTTDDDETTHKRQSEKGNKNSSTKTHSWTSKPGSVQVSNGSGTLEIVAQAKKMSKPRNQPKREDDMSVLCSVPPLCFRLNARPPSGFLYYFAYGPNMNPDRLSTYLGCDKTPQRFWALLFGFGLVFNKKGSEEKETGGFPNLEYNPCSSVEGCIFQLSSSQLDSLDKFVGYPQHFEHVVLPTWMSNCVNSDDLGVAQYCVPAVTYIAKDHSTWQEPVQPNEFVLSQCLKAADMVTPSYKEHLSAFTSPVLSLLPAIAAS